MSNYSDAIISTNPTIFTWNTACLVTRLSPESMQELEAMIRRVVHEEVSVLIEDEDEQEQEQEDTTISPFIGRD